MLLLNYVAVDVLVGTCTVPVIPEGKHYIYLLSVVHLLV